MNTMNDADMLQQSVQQACPDLPEWLVWKDPGAPTLEAILNGGAPEVWARLYRELVEPHQSNDRYFSPLKGLDPARLLHRAHHMLLLTMLKLTADSGTYSERYRQYITLEALALPKEGISMFSLLYAPACSCLEGERIDRRNDAQREDWAAAWLAYALAYGQPHPALQLFSTQAYDWLEATRPRMVDHELLWVAKGWGKTAAAEQTAQSEQPEAEPELSACPYRIRPQKVTDFFKVIHAMLKADIFIDPATNKNPNIEKLMLALGDFFCVKTKSTPYKLISAAKSNSDNYLQIFDTLRDKAQEYYQEGLDKNKKA